MPRWFIETPSDTEIVVNGTGERLPGGDAEARRIGLRPERHRQGVFSPCWLTMPTSGLSEVLVAEADRAQEGAVRGPVEPFLDDGRAELLRGGVMRRANPEERTSASIDASRRRPSAVARSKAQSSGQRANCASICGCGW